MGSRPGCSCGCNGSSRQTSTITDVLIAQRDDTTRQLSEVDALDQYQRARTQLEQVMGNILEKNDVNLEEAKNGQVGRPPDPNIMEVQGNKITYKKTLIDQERGSLQFTGWSTTDPKDNAWSVEGPALGAGMRVHGNRAMMRIGLFTIRSVVALEPYTALNIEPGQEFNWSYTYDYYTLPRQ